MEMRAGELHIHKKVLVFSALDCPPKSLNDIELNSLSKLIDTGPITSYEKDMRILNNKINKMGDHGACHREP